MSLTTPVVLKTKIMPPMLKKGLVTRTRLLEAIQNGSQGRMTLVCAPAGFGKTTLLAQWVHARYRRFAWLTLDERDNDPVRFWRYAACSLAETLQDPDKSRLLTLAGNLNGLSLAAFLDAFINEIYEWAEPATWILDDYHFIRDPRIHESLSYFIEYIPEHLNLLISSRTELPFGTVKWLSKNESQEIGAEGLQFTPDEAEIFCGEAAGVEINVQQAGELNKRTEGWVTGLQLALLSIRSGLAVDRCIEQFQGSHRNVTDYIFYEVISKLPEDLYRFVCKTAVLERFNAQICDAVTEMQGSGSMLEQLKRLNLFLVPLDEKNEWFRYHHLFSGALRELFKRQRPGEWDKLNRLASRAFAQIGELDEAIEHAMGAKDYEQAERLMKAQIPTLLESGELVNLRRWFESFPSFYPLDPEVELFYAFVLVLTGSFEQAEKRLVDLGKANPALHSEEWNQLQSGILFVRSNLMFASGAFANWFAFIESMPDDFLPANKAFYMFNYNKLEPFVRRTSIGLKGALSADTEKIGTMFLGVLAAHGWQQSLISLYTKQSLSEGYYEWNRIEESRQFLSELTALAGGMDIPGIRVPMLLMKARFHVLDGNDELAHDTLDEALEPEGYSCESPWGRQILSFKIRLYLAGGKLPAAKKLMARLGITPKDKPTFQREYEYVTLARLLGKQRKEAEALRLLALLLPQSEREGLLSGIVEISILRALLEDQRGQRTEALRSLHAALLLGESNGYIRSFVDEGKPMAALLGRYASAMFPDDKKSLPSKDLREELRGDVSVEYVRRLLAQFPAAQPETAAAAPSGLGPEPLNRSEYELLRLIAVGASNKEMAAELALSEGTVKVYLSRLYEKLAVSSRTQALAFARQHGLLP